MKSHQNKEGPGPGAGTGPGARPGAGPGAGPVANFGNRQRTRPVLLTKCTDEMQKTDRPSAKRPVFRDGSPGKFSDLEHPPLLAGQGLGAITCRPAYHEVADAFIVSLQTERSQ